LPRLVDLRKNVFLKFALKTIFVAANSYSGQKYLNLVRAKILGIFYQLQHFYYVETLPKILKFLNFFILRAQYIIAEGTQKYLRLLLGQKV